MSHLCKVIISNLLADKQTEAPENSVSCAIGRRMVCLSQAHSMLKPACSPCTASPLECITPPRQYLLYTALPVLKRNRNIIRGTLIIRTSLPIQSPSRERSSVNGQLAPWAGLRTTDVHGMSGPDDARSWRRQSRLKGLKETVPTIPTSTEM